MVRDDRDNPFDNIFDEIERMMNDMTGDDVGFTPETHIDIYDEGSILRFVADFPGIDKDAIDFRYDGETLTINAANDRHEYGGHIRPPTHVDERSVSAVFNDGILQITFDHVEDFATTGAE